MPSPGHETPTLPGNHAGYVLRILGPMELAGKYEWYELTLAPGTARYPADQNHAPRNVGKAEARALLVVVHR